MATLRFVGREAELRTIAAALDDARDGRGGLILLSGEAGIGKTRFAEAASQYAQGRGLTVGWGRAWESAGAPAYWPWIQLGRLLAPRLASLLHGASSSEERFALFDEAATALFESSAAAGGLIVLDDMHAADAPSLELLRFLAPTLASSRLLVVATHRDPERVEPATAQALAEVARVGFSLPLRGISEIDVAQLIDHAHGAADPGAAQRIHAATDGNPLFVTELVALLAGARVPDPRAKTAIPAGIRDALRRRLSRLSSAAVGVLETAAVTGREFSAAVVADAIGLQPEHVLRCLDEVVAVGLIQRTPSAADSYRFAHALVFETLADDLPPRRCAELHLAVGDALERRYGQRAPKHAAELGHHLKAALPLADPGRARHYLVLAGERALQQLAFEEAQRLFGQAVELLDTAGGGDIGLRCDVLVQLGEAHSRLGNFGSARDAFDEALELATRLNDPDRMAHAALGYAGPKLAGSMPNERFTKRLRAALGAGPAAGLQVELLARLAVEFDLRSSMEERRKPADEALVLAREAGEPTLIAQAIRAQAATGWSHDTLGEILRLADELLALDADPRFALDALGWRQVVLMQLGDRRGAESAAAEHARLADELRDPVHRMLAILTRGGMALMDGRLGDSEVAISELLPYTRHVGTLRGLAETAITTLQMPLTIWGRGNAEALAEPLARLARRFPPVLSFAGITATVHARTGRRDTALEWYERVVDEAIERPVDERWDGLMVPLAWLCFDLQDASRAGRIYQAIAPMSGRFAAVSVWSAVANTLGAWDTYIGLVAHTMGEHALAREHFERGRALDRKIGARLWMAQGMAWEARAMRRMRDPDRGRADRLLEQSKSLAEELGLEHLLAELAASDVQRRAAFIRTEAGWEVAWGSSRTQVTDSVGMSIIARLIHAPGEDLHVLELLGEDRLVGGARRLHADLLEDLDDAQERLDAERVAAAQAVREALVRELVDAPQVERSRVNVTRAIARALKRIRAEQPELATHLDRSLRRGVICAYEPRVGDEVEWEQAHEGAPADGRRPLRPSGPVAR